MTAILGYTNGHTVWIGGDSLTIDTGSYSKWVDTEPKVYSFDSAYGRMVVGVAGNCLPAQQIAHHFTPVECVAGKEGVIKNILPRLRQALEDVPEDDKDFELLLGYRGHLYSVDSKLVVLEPGNGVACVGCGGEYALGYFKALLHEDPEGATKDLIRRALEETSKHSAAVGPPFVVLNTGEMNE